MTKKMFSKKMALAATACAAALALTAVPAASAVTYEGVEPNGLIGTAESVGLGERVCGVLEHDEDNDWYRINVPVYGSYTLKYVSDNAAGWYQCINFYNNNRDKLLDTTVTTDHYSMRYATYTLPAGVAYVQVERGSSSSTDWQYELELDYNTGTPALGTPKTSKTTLSASWSKVKNATGYQVKVGGKTYKTSTNSVRVSGLKSKKTQSVKVRAYTTLEGKTFYGNWSVTKKVRTK